MEQRTTYGKKDNGELNLDDGSAPLGGLRLSGTLVEDMTETNSEVNITGTEHAEADGAAEGLL